MTPGTEDGPRDDRVDDRVDDSRTLAFAPAAYEAVLTHARTGSPEEVCGVLGGTRDESTAGSGARSVVRSVHRTANVAERPRTEYRIDPAEQYDAMRDVEARDDDVVGFYHSHPTGPPHPSATDRDRATWPGYSYVIVTLVDGAEPSVGSWRWTGGAFEPEAVLVE